MATLEAIQAKIKKLQQQANVLQVKSQRAAIAEIHAIMLKNGLTLEHIPEPAPGRRAAKGANTPVNKGLKTKGKLPPMYANPKTGETWSGRARPPAWIKDVKDRRKFLIDKNGDANGIALKIAKAAKNGKAKAAAKKPVAPRYKDPESGATWSGRGRAPAWIAAVEDRTPYLIEQVGA
jgi:DNA-binding protein H-NS